MGAACCGSRDQTVKGSTTDTNNINNIDIVGYGSGMKKAYSSAGNIAGDDCEKFNSAFASNDIKEMIRLLSSKQSVDPLEEPLHPWAEQPKTVGALAATQLAFLANADNQSGTKTNKDEIRKQGGIEALVTYLDSTEQDRYESGVVSLSFLSLESDITCHMLLELDIIEKLSKLFRSKKENMRSAIGCTLRNVYVLNEDTRRKFIKEGALKEFIDLLKLSDTEGSIDMIFEALFNVDDLITVNNEVVPEFADALKAAGVLPLLTALYSCPDAEVVDLARSINEKIDAVMTES
eukprot:GHVR01024818.1.p1 GENE.GHVR01024818.1~~GHVR01024818.1.p1  ORF type:complete len:292 (+),score=72.72 GHVR01024818.1:101-976(+)